MIAGVTRLGRVLRQQVGPVLAVVQPAGWVAVVLVVAGWVGAAWTGWVELAMAACSGLTLLLLAVGFTLRQVSLSADVAAVPDRVVAGGTYDLVAAVYPPQGRGSPACRLEVILDGEPFEAGLPAIGAGERFTFSDQRDAGRRRVVRIGPPSVVHGDPLGLLRRRAPVGEERLLYVHPRTEPLEPLGAGVLRDLEGVVTDRRTDSDLAFHALREYVRGDDLRHVHWRSSARISSLGVGQRLLVRQYVETRRSKLVVVVSADRAEYTADPLGAQPPGVQPLGSQPMGVQDAFELAVSVAGSLALRGLGDGQDTTLVVGSRVVTGHSPRQVLDALCEVELGDATQGLRGAAARAVRAVPGASNAFLVVGEALPGAALRGCAQVFGAGPRLVGIRAMPGAQPAVHTVQGLGLVTLGGLADLTGLLWRQARTGA